MLTFGFVNFETGATKSTTYSNLSTTPPAAISEEPRQEFSHRFILHDHSSVCIIKRSTAKPQFAFCLRCSAFPRGFRVNPAFAGYRESERGEGDGSRLCAGDGAPLREGTLMKITFLIILLAMMVVHGTASALEPQDIKDFPTCKYCSMNRAQFAHSRIVVEYDDGTRFGACSLHCAAVNFAINLNKNPKAIRVGDYYSTELIDAETAYWVIGGMKPGVMTKRGKWAFQRKNDAEKFISENGGEMTAFEQALNAAYEDMYMDLKMIRSKRKIR